MGQGRWSLAKKESWNTEHQGQNRKWERFSDKNGRVLRQSHTGLSLVRESALHQRSLAEGRPTHLRCGGCDCPAAFASSSEGAILVPAWTVRLTRRGNCLLGTHCIQRISVASVTSNIFWG